MMPAESIEFLTALRAIVVDVREKGARPQDHRLKSAQAMIEHELAPLLPAAANEDLTTVEPAEL